MIKKKSLFDHINQITSVQNPNYWDEISNAMLIEQYRYYLMSNVSVWKKEVIDFYLTSVYKFLRDSKLNILSSILLSHKFSNIPR